MSLYNKVLSLDTLRYSFDSIYQVLDAKSLYLIKVRGGERLICQKDLIKQGTLEEFESIFKGKIVRKQID